MKIHIRSYQRKNKLISKPCPLVKLITIIVKNKSSENRQNEFQYESYKNISQEKVHIPRAKAYSQKARKITLTRIIYVDSYQQ